MAPSLAFGSEEKLADWMALASSGSFFNNREEGAMVESHSAQLLYLLQETHFPAGSIWQARSPLPLSGPPLPLAPACLKPPPSLQHIQSLRGFGPLERKGGFPPLFFFQRGGHAMFYACICYAKITIIPPSKAHLLPFSILSISK